MAHRTLTQRLLNSLRKSIIDKPPYISGTLRPPNPSFSLFYKDKVSKDGHAARHINLANATPDELERLSQACEPASFGRNQENVLDETYRKAGKMDLECFNPSPMLDPVHSNLLKIVRGNLLEGTQSTKSIKTELYKLNVYGKGSFFKPHVDTPRSEKMFGSLVIVFPTPHEGGALHLRHRGQEWTIDSGQELATTKGNPPISYAAFFSDIEHEVAPVISGHRITLTYNLYFDDDGPISENDVHFSHPQPEIESAFRDAFKTLLENPEFLPNGGTLAFGLRHVYPIENDLEHVYGALKGSDAIVYQTFRALGFEPVLYLYYQDDQPVVHIIKANKGMIIDKFVDFPEEEDEDENDPNNVLLREGGIPVTEPSQDIRYSAPKDREQVEWVTPMTEFNRQKSPYLHYGNESSLGWAYGDVCMMVRIGKAGDRLAYTTVAELRKKYKDKDIYDLDEDEESA